LKRPEKEFQQRRLQTTAVESHTFRIPFGL
jgi:hypothetical protein